MQQSVAAAAPVPTKKIPRSQWPELTLSVQGNDAQESAVLLQQDTNKESQFLERGLIQLEIYLQTISKEN